MPWLVGGAVCLDQARGDRASHERPGYLRVYRAIAIQFSAHSRRGDFATEVSFPHWLAKAYGEDGFIDVIYSSGNGVVQVDQEWFTHACEGEILGVPVKLCAVEEMIWSKGYVQERERFDGADIAHLIRCRGKTMDWARPLLRRSGITGGFSSATLSPSVSFIRLGDPRYPAGWSKSFPRGWLMRSMGRSPRGGRASARCSRANSTCRISANGATTTPG